MQCFVVVVFVVVAAAAAASCLRKTFACVIMRLLVTVPEFGGPRTDACVVP